jgi:hypothetical protein
MLLLLIIIIIIIIVLIVKEEIKVISPRLSGMNWNSNPGVFDDKKPESGVGGCGLNGRIFA